jgi:hypothetical protein
VVKEFLSRDLRLEYELRDVTRDPGAAREFLALGARLPPVTVIGERIIEGFQPEELIAAVEAAEGQQ